MNKKRVFAAALAVTLTAAGCGSSKSTGTSGSGGSAGGKTITVGLLTDATGLAASGNKTSIQGVEAGIVRAARDGYRIKYVLADTTSSPAGALTAAQTLVTQDHVLAVIAVSSLAFAAAGYLTSHNVPVIGVSEDGPEWLTAQNMFSIYGALHTTKVSTTAGQFLKLEGGTNLASVGYSISPISSEAAKSTAASAEAAGLKVGYLNTSFPFGSTNVQPAVLAMKSAGVDAFTASVDPNTAYAFIAALRQAGVKLKVAFLPAGYGADVLQAGPGALQDAQNVYFFEAFQPMEMHTAATEEFAADLKKVGVNLDPANNMYSGYVSVILLEQALKAAGANATQASLLQALRGIHAFDAGGLYGTHTIDINDRQNIVSGPDNCEYAVKLVGQSFELVPGADPICGTVIPGKTVSPST